MRYRFFLVLIILTLSAVAKESTAERHEYHTVSKARLERLSRGVNISHWFWNTPPNPDSSYFEQYITAADIQLLRSTGVRHVRLPIDILLLFDWDNPVGLKSQYLPYIDRAIQMFVSQKIAVILVPFGSLDYLGVQEQYLDRAIYFWERFAEYIREYDSEYVFIEVANEPEVQDPLYWSALQEQFIAVIRQQAPEHTIITATPLRFSEADDAFGVSYALAETEPSSDPNVVYGIYFYEPFYFTHQGVSWGDPIFQYLRNVPYPSDALNIVPVIEQLQQEMNPEVFNEVSPHLWQYSQETWDINVLEARLQPAIQWAVSHGVPLMVTEFGVNRKGTSPLYRLNWLRDMRTLLDRYQLGWTVWDYSGCADTMRTHRELGDQERALK